jgi:cyclopropane-fatty-acyl-phospholipid synthase
MSMTITDTQPTQRLKTAALRLAEQGFCPDAAIRGGIRHLLKQRLREIGPVDARSAAQKESRFIEEMRRAPVALVPETANEQHYEVPVEFFQHVLGPHLKYSSAFWPAGTATLGQAEAAGLRESCLHADLKDGQTILELGCGWGSLTLWMASRFPNSRITAVSNSASQRAYIEAQARALGVENRLQVMTRDMNSFETHLGQFDRVVSVEMFEHMRNWPVLFERVRRWLGPDGKFFLHVFAHRTVPYLFEDRGADDWMSRHFFTGGMMPSDGLPLTCQNHLFCIGRWRWDGTHYEKTANAWLINMDAARGQLRPVMERIYGSAQAGVWWARWRMFFMACAELFGFAEGQQWGVSHYLFEKT